MTPSPAQALPRVLVVEDDPSIRRLLRKYLEKLGLEVEEADNGRVARELLGRMKPALVCLDLVLPEASGFDVCAAMRADARLRDVPVLIVSARSMPPDRAQAEAAGATAYLVKPIRWATFSRTVEALLGRPAP